MIRFKRSPESGAFKFESLAEPGATWSQGTSLASPRRMSQGGKQWCPLSWGGLFEAAVGLSSLNS